MNCGRRPTPRAAPSAHRNNDFSFGASAFDVGQSFGNVRKRIGFVDDDLQLSLFDEAGKLGKLAAAWMHEKISIADPCAPRSRPDTVADNPENGGKSPAAAKVLDRHLGLWNTGYRDDLGSRLHDFEHLLQSFAADQVKPRIKSGFRSGYILRRITDHPVTAERAHQRLTSLRSCCRHLCAQPFGDLNRKAAAPSGPA